MSEAFHGSGEAPDYVLSTEVLIHDMNSGEYSKYGHALLMVNIDEDGKIRILLLKHNEKDDDHVGKNELGPLAETLQAVPNDGSNESGDEKQIILTHEMFRVDYTLEGRGRVIPRSIEEELGKCALGLILSVPVGIGEDSYQGVMRWHMSRDMLGSIADTKGYYTIVQCANPELIDELDFSDNNEISGAGWYTLDELSKILSGESKEQLRPGMTEFISLFLLKLREWETADAFNRPDVWEGLKLEWDDSVEGVDLRFKPETRDTSGLVDE